MKTFVLLLAEPVPIWQGMVMMVVLTIVILGLTFFGFYFGLKALGRMLDRRRGRWEATAAELSLTVENDRPAIGVYKPLTGERKGYKVEVNYFTIGTQESGSGVKDCVEVKVDHSSQLDFSFMLCKREMFFQRVEAFFDAAGAGIGHEPFDKVFEITTSSKSDLISLLDVEMLDAESSSLLTDLMLAARKYPRVQLSDSFVTLGIMTDPNRPEAIESLIDRALYLISRIDAARVKTGLSA